MQVLFSDEDGFYGTCFVLLGAFGSLDIMRSNPRGVEVFYPLFSYYQWPCFASCCLLFQSHTFLFESGFFELVFNRGA